MGRFHQPEKYARDSDDAAVPQPPEQQAPPPAPAADEFAPAPLSFRNMAPVVPVEGSNPLAKIGFLATLLYMFGICSLSEELSVAFFGIKPYLTTWTGVIAVTAAVFAGGLGRFFRFVPSRLLLGFAFWLALCVPFSAWRSASLDLVFNYLGRNLIVAVLMMMTVTTWKQLKLVFYAMTASSLAISLAVRSSLVDLSSDDSRLAFAGGRLGNPNDLATHMLVLLPFVVGLFFLSGKLSLLRPASILTALVSLYTILHTGSRGAMIALCAMGVLLLWKLQSAVHKLVICVLAFVAFAGAVAVLPHNVIQRYSLLFANNDEIVPENLMEAQALESSESRRAILIRSLEITMANPIFGVGPGTFQIAEADRAKEEGRRGSWLQTHNSYTQASSEGGVPAFLLFAGAIFLTLATAARYHKRLSRIPEFEKESTTALVIFLSLAGFAVNILFSSLAYTFYLPTLVGCLGSFVLVMDRELAVWEKRNRDNPAPLPVSSIGSTPGFAAKLARQPVWRPGA